MAIFIRRKGEVFNFKESVPTVKHDGENSFSGLDLKKKKSSGSLEKAEVGTSNLLTIQSLYISPSCASKASILIQIHKSCAEDRSNILPVILPQV